MGGTDNQKTVPKILPGRVRSERVRCGRANCKCARGELHGPYFYRYAWADGRRAKLYVRPADAEAVRRACEAHRKLRAEMSAGRAEYKSVLARAMLRSLGL